MLRPMLAATVVALTAAVPGPAPAQVTSACLEPLDYIQDLRGRDGVDSITAEKVETLAEDGRLLCERGLDGQAQGKFKRAAQLLEEALQTE